MSRESGDHAGFVSGAAASVSRMRSFVATSSTQMSRVPLLSGVTSSS